jgi:hypothetical protein
VLFDLNGVFAWCLFIYCGGDSKYTFGWFELIVGWFYMGGKYCIIFINLRVIFQKFWEDIFLKWSVWCVFIYFGGVVKQNLFYMCWNPLSMEWNRFSLDQSLMSLSQLFQTRLQNR